MSIKFNGETMMSVKWILTRLERVSTSPYYLSFWANSLINCIRSTRLLNLIFCSQEELVERLSKKLKVLETEQMMLAEESTANDTLGHDVTFKVAQKVRPADSTKYRSYVDDVGYITKLLLSLSGRLARTENSLHIIGDKASPDKVSSWKIRTFGSRAAH